MAASDAVPHTATPSACALPAGLRLLAAAAWTHTRGPALLLAALYAIGGTLPAVKVALTATLLGRLLHAAGRGPAALPAILLPALALAVAALAEYSLFTFWPVLKELCVLRLQRGLDGDLLAHLADLDLATRERPECDNLLQRAGAPGSTAGDLLETCLNWLRSGSAVLSLSVVIATVHWWLPCALIAGALPLAIAETRQSLARRALDLDQSADNRLLGHLADLVTSRAAAPEVRLFGLTAPLLDRWQTLRLRLARTRTWLAVRQSAATLPHTAAARLCTFGGIAVLGLTTDLDPGRLVALVGGVVGLVAELGSAAHMAGSVQDGAERMRDTWSLLRLGPTERIPPVEPVTLPAPSAGDLPPAADAPTPPTRPPLPRGAIACACVTFRYPGTTAPALDRCTLHIRPGERLALVGPNGAGKSTLVKCLLGLYHPEQGSIGVGGTIAPVFQDYLRPEFTAAEAVAFGNPAALYDGARLRRAAAAGGAAGFPESLPRAYDTPLGRSLYDDGAELSGGQWQRVAISRALFSEPDVLVLDEPAAALDPKAEAELYAQFREVAAPRTILLISHRLGSARLAQRIAVMDRGRIVETGPHDELLARKGLYADMWEAQAAWYT